MKRMIMGTFAILFVILFTACVESSSGSTVAVNHAPVVTQSLVTKSVTENSSLTYDITLNITDSDGDSLNVASLVMADGSSLPSGISLVGNNLEVADTISVNDGENLTYDLNATVSDGEDNVSYSLQVVIQDRANDSLLTYTINIVTSIDSNETLNGSIVLTDSDGLSANTIAFDLLDLNDSNLSVYSGTMTDVGSDGNFTFSIDLPANSISASNYVFVTTAISPVIGGENPQSDVVITHDLQVISTPTISLANQTVNDNGALASTDLPTPTVTNVNAGAAYSIVADPTGGKITINAATGVATWNGDLFANTDYSITIKVLNTDGGTSSTTFTLTVINNG